MKLPVAVGVPLIVITSADQEVVTPAGKPVTVPIPVAIVVVCVIFVKATFTASVGVDDPALTVLSTQGVTVVGVVIAGEGPTALVATTEKI
jgi:hypothetical protein